MNREIKRLTEISIFAAIIIVLQLIATYINISGFPITLTLIPIIVAGFVYGPYIGLLMGLVFGGIVTFMVITGADPTGASMLAYNPLATIGACMCKGGLCGLVSSLLYKYLPIKNETIKTTIAAISCPIVNTLTFLVFLMLFFDGTIKVFIGAFLSINFVIELLINGLIAPKLTDLILHNKKRY